MRHEQGGTRARGGVWREEQKPTAKDVTELYQAARQLLLNTERTAFLDPSLDRVRAALEPFEESMRGKRDVGINAEQGLYVIPESHGYSCLGFDVALTRYTAIAAWLRKERLQQDDLPPEARGTMRAYTGYRTLLDRAGAIASGTSCAARPN